MSEERLGSLVLQVKQDPVHHCDECRHCVRVAATDWCRAFGDVRTDAIRLRGNRLNLTCRGFAERPKPAPGLLSRLFGGRS